MTNKCIKPGTELLVWYGDDYGDTLGLERAPEDYDYIRGSAHVSTVQGNYP